MMNNQSAIGVFDSGVGGLTVVRALIERLPYENIVYFGDTARVPYGVKSRNTIEQFTEQMVQFLMEQNVKALVIACNTIAAVAGERVRRLAGPLPVFDVISAGADAAITHSQNGPIGVIATTTTVNSNAYARAIAIRQPNYRVISQACPLLVPLVEEGWLDHEVTRLTLREYLPPLLADRIDTLVLGCTHYPLLKPLIREEIPDIPLVDSALTTAEAVACELEKRHLLNPTTQTPDYRFFVSDIPLRFRAIGERFLNRPIDQLEMVSLG